MSKISVELSDEELELIKYLKEKRKTSGRDVIRRALGLYGMVQKASEEGEKVIIENPVSKKAKQLINW